MADQTIIAHPTSEDWACFLEWAGDEGWSVPAYETRLLQTDLADAVTVLKKGRSCQGFVSAVSYEKSAWIGNLIVPKKIRGQGLGRRLFDTALTDLTARQVSSVWLTASLSGRPLYLQYGFRDFGTVERWSLGAGQRPEKAISAGSADLLFEFDRLVWNESRAVLLDAIKNDSLTFAVGSTVAWLQCHDDIQVIGPVYSRSRSGREMRTVLLACLAHAAPGRPVMIDLVNHHPMRSLLQSAGFGKTGQNALMVKGSHDHIDHGCLVSLVSLGSMG